MLGLLYRAPGNQSSVSYGQGSTLGSAWTTTTSNQYDGTWSLTAGVTAGSGGGGGGGSVSVSGGGSGTVNGGFTSASSSSNTVTTTKTTTESLSLVSSGDALDHESDVFILWTNPEMVLTLTGTAPTQVVTATMQTIGNQPMSWLAVTAGELDGSVTPADPTVATFLAKLTAADKTSILALDALRAGDPSWYPQRYVALPSTIEVAGPDVGIVDQVSFQGQNTTQAMQQLTNTSYTGDSFGLSIAAQVFSLGFTEGGKQTASTVVSGTSTLGTQQTASATIKSSTSGVDAVYDVYYDSLFGSFAFAPAVSRRASPCAGGGPGQLFDGHMAGCSGVVPFASRTSLCAHGAHVCSAAEYLSHFAGAPPLYDYWTNDALNYGGSGSNACFASTTSGNACPSGQPMRVCSGTKDPLGNACNWVGCGSDTTTPNDFFGGCAGNNTAGALCCY